MSKIKKRIAKWLGIGPTPSEIARENFAKMGNYLSEGIESGLRDTTGMSVGVSLDDEVLEYLKNAKPGIYNTPEGVYIVLEKEPVTTYKVAVILKEPDIMNEISGEVTIPMERLCQSLTDGTKGVKIGDYLIPTSEIRFFRLLKDDE